MRMTKPAYNKPPMGKVTGGGMPRPSMDLPTVKKPMTGGGMPKMDKKAMKMDSIQRRLTGG